MSRRALVLPYRRKGEQLNLNLNLRFIEVIFQYPSDPTFSMNFSYGDTALSPEKVAYDAIRSAMMTYCTDRIAELDADLTGWNIIY